MRTRILSLTTLIMVVALGATACSSPTAPRAKDATVGADSTGWLGVYKSGYIISTGGHGHNHGHGHGNGNDGGSDENGNGGSND